MTHRGFRVAAIAMLAALSSAGVAVRAEDGKGVEIERPAAAPTPEPETGYRPPWADPNAAPSMPGIENDPTPFNPADVDQNSDTLNINNLDQ